MTGTTTSLEALQVNQRWVVEEDGKAGFVSRFSRCYGVVDTKMLDGKGRPRATGFESNNLRSAEDYAYQLNFGRVVRRLPSSSAIRGY